MRRNRAKTASSLAVLISAAFSIYAAFLFGAVAIFGAAIAGIVALFKRKSADGEPVVSGGPAARAAPDRFADAGRPIEYTTPEDTTAYKLFLDALNQPHLLIAGATGSGKSVVVGGIMDAIMRHSPEDVKSGKRVILIDPKRVELVQFRDIPHCVQYASEPAEMVSALRYAMGLADARYRDMASRGSRRWEYSDVYVIIDEFADLMTTNSRAVKPLVQRLAQVGRAAGVHVILCTQTPIVKVLPTEIRCNFDSRIGLRARSAQDSRNIIDKPGLERLPKCGRGYYMTPDVQGYLDIPYVKPDELQKLVDFWVRRKAA